MGSSGCGFCDIKGGWCALYLICLLTNASDIVACGMIFVWRGDCLIHNILIDMCSCSVHLLNFCYHLLKFYVIIR